MAIVTPPQNRSVPEGANASFSIVASGASPLGYQWYRSPSTILPGKTSSQLTLNSVSTNDAGSYSCTASNAYGTAPSASASLTISQNQIRAAVNALRKVLTTNAP